MSFGTAKMANSTKYNLSVRHFTGFLIGAMVMIFSFSAMAYHIEMYAPLSARHYDEYWLEWDIDRGYFEWSWGDDTFGFGASFAVLSDPLDPAYDAALVKISYLYFPFSCESGFANFYEFPGYDIRYPIFDSYDEVLEIPVNQEFYLPFDNPGHTIINFTSYPAVADPSKGFAYASVMGGVDACWWAEFIRPVEALPEPASLLLMGLGLICLAGMRRKFKRS